MSTKYLKITNTAENVSRIALEKLGLSTKKNDPNTIGQFGSGIKFAPIAALRNGWEWWFSGTDNTGPFVMQYVKQMEEGIECIAYDYGDYRKPSSFTLEAGSLSWIDSFQIYREAVANAIDGAVDGGSWNISIVDKSEIKPVSGEFSVFITAAPELMQIHNNFDRYFSVNREVLIKSNQVSILKKIDDLFRVYCHGVLVYSSDEYTSVFDYNIDSIKLNEERTVQSLWDLEYTISSTLSQVSDKQLCRDFVSAGMISNNHFEFARANVSAYSFSGSYGGIRDAFENIYGDNCVIFDREAMAFGVKDAITLRGYNPVYVSNDNLYSILTNKNVKNYLTVAGEEYKFNTDFNLIDYPNVVKALDIARHFEPGLDDVINSDRIAIFSSEVEKNLGMTINMKKPIGDRIILINIDHAHDSVENIISTIIHEYDHLSSGYVDGNDQGKKFRDLADIRIGKLMMKYFRESVMKVVDGMIVFPINKLSSLGGSMDWDIIPFSSSDFATLRVAKRMFVINGDAIYYGSEIKKPMSGLLSVNEEGNGLTIKHLENITKVDDI
jgi:hypothetical protein